MVNVRRRDFDQDVVEEPARESPPRACAAAQHPAPRTVTFRLPPRPCLASRAQRAFRHGVGIDGKCPHHGT